MSDVMRHSRLFEKRVNPKGKSFISWIYIIVTIPLILPLLPILILSEGIFFVGTALADLLSYAIMLEGD